VAERRIAKPQRAGQTFEIDGCGRVHQNVVLCLADEAGHPSFGAGIPDALLDQAEQNEDLARV
jgi:hypothetical protein